MERWFLPLAGVALAAPAIACAKPIAFANGTTVMAEYGADTMKEEQVFYAPEYNYSIGGGHIEFDSDESSNVERITYARLNYLVHRWNLDNAQANVFAWGGLGGATRNDFQGTQLALNAGAQADYETRRVYASLKTDLQRADAFNYRVDTLQLGIAPYEHTYNGLATWLLLQGREYTGGVHRGVERAFLVRLFKGGAWVEAGFTTQRRIQAMVMFNY